MKIWPEPSRSAGIFIFSGEICRFRWATTQTWTKPISIRSASHPECESNTEICMQGLDQRRSKGNRTVSKENFSFFVFYEWNCLETSRSTLIRPYYYVFERIGRKGNFEYITSGFTWRFWARIFRNAWFWFCLMIWCLKLRMNLWFFHWLALLSLTGPIHHFFHPSSFSFYSVIGAGVPCFWWGIRALNCRGFNSVMKIHQWISENWWTCWWFLALMNFRVFWFVLGDFLFWS